MTTVGDGPLGRIVRDQTRVRELRQVDVVERHLYVLERVGCRLVGGIAGDHRLGDLHPGHWFVPSFEHGENGPPSLVRQALDHVVPSRILRLEDLPELRVSVDRMVRRAHRPVATIVDDEAGGFEEREVDLHEFEVGSATLRRRYLVRGGPGLGRDNLPGERSLVQGSGLSVEDGQDVTSSSVTDAIEEGGRFRRPGSAHVHGTDEGPNGQVACPLTIRRR